jgi:hypothetical protein
MAGELPLSVREICDEELVVREIGETEPPVFPRRFKSCAV